MATAQPHEFRWGVIATGDICRKVIADFLVDPKTRDVHDVVHKIVAVGSRSVDKASLVQDDYPAIRLTPLFFPGPTVHRRDRQGQERQSIRLVRGSVPRSGIASCVNGIISYQTQYTRSP
jgi:hypothetical protein